MEGGFSFFLYGYGGRKFLIMRKVGERMYCSTAPAAYRSSQESTAEAERGN